MKTNKKFRDMSRLDYLTGCVLQGLMANPERYKYIADLVARKELTQNEATAKNTSKALQIAQAQEALLDRTERTSR